MGAPFTEDEKSRIRSYLGYPSFELLGPSITFGFPSASQPLFILDAAFLKISPEARERVRFDLCRLDELEALQSKNMRRAGVDKAGNVSMDARRGRMDLINERRRWVRRLADDLGSFPNPNSQMYGVGDVRVFES